MESALDFLIIVATDYIFQGQMGMRGKKRKNNSILVILSFNVTFNTAAVIREEPQNAISST